MSGKIRSVNKLARTHNRMAFIMPAVVGFLAVMLIIAFFMYSRFSHQARMAVTGDQSAIARYFLESYAAEVLWQIRKQRNIEGTSVYEAFRNGTGVDVCPLDYQPGSLLVQLADELEIEIGPMVVNFDGVETIPFAASAFNQVGSNEEKRGTMAIICQISRLGRNFSLEIHYQFKVVMLATPVIRSFVLFFDQIHLEQTEMFGTSDKINIIPIRTNFAPANRSAITLWGWDPENPAMNGSVFLGNDDQKISLNLVGGAFGVHPSGDRANLEDLWQVSPSAFDATAQIAEFGYEELLTDNAGNPLLVRGASVPMAFRGHYTRFGLLGFSEEVTEPDFFGNFRLENFLSTDPSYVRLLQTPQSFSLASSLRLHGNRIHDDFNGFARNIFGRVYARFFLLSFFDAPSIGSPLPYNPNPDHSISFAQYGGVQRIPFRPVAGRYANYMSRVVSGVVDPAVLGDESSVPLNRDDDMIHGLLASSDFQSLDGLVPATNFSAIAPAWFAAGGQLSNTTRPEIVRGSILERVSRFYKNGEDFKKHSGLLDQRHERFWIDGVVFINGDLDLSEGISTDDVRGGVILVNGEIKLGNVTRGLGDELNEQVSNSNKTLEMDKIITLVSLTGDKIILTGNRYYGVHLLSFNSSPSAAVDQLQFDNGDDFVLFGALGMSTPGMDSISRQLQNRELFPFFNFSPALAATTASYTVNINEQVTHYDFSVR